MSAEEQAELANLQAMKAQRNEWEERQELAALKAKRDKGETSGWSDFWEGVALSGIDLVSGVKDLTGNLDENERATLAQVKKDASDSGWTTAGKVVSEIAQLGIPGGAIAKGVKGLSKAKAAAALIGGETAAAAALGGARLPDAGETRVGNAALEGGLSLVGGIGGQVLAKTMRGAAKSPAAQELLDKGVTMTPGQQAASPAVTSLEQGLDYVPVFSRAGKEGREEGLKGWNKAILNKAAPEGAEITAIGPAGGAQLKTAVNKAYDDAWQGAGDVSDEVAFDMIESLSGAGARLGKKDQRVLNNLIDDVVEVSAAGGGSSTKTIDDILRRELSTAGAKKYDLSKVLDEARGKLRASVPENVEALAKIDAKYPAYLTARNAIKRGAREDGVFTPNQLTTSTGVVGKGLSETGEAALQDAAKRGRDTLGRDIQEPLPGLWRRFVRGAHPLFAKGVGETFMGNTRPQNFVTKQWLDNPRVDALRGLVSPGKLAPAFNTDD